MIKLRCMLLAVVGCAMAAAAQAEGPCAFEGARTLDKCLGSSRGPLQAKAPLLDDVSMALLTDATDNDALEMISDVKENTHYKMPGIASLRLDIGDDAIDGFETRDALTVVANRRASLRKVQYVIVPVAVLRQRDTHDITPADGLGSMEGKLLLSRVLDTSRLLIGATKSSVCATERDHQRYCIEISNLSSNSEFVHQPLLAVDMDRYARAFHLTDTVALLEGLVIRIDETKPFVSVAADARAVRGTVENVAVWQPGQANVALLGWVQPAAPVAQAAQAGK